MKQVLRALSIFAVAAMFVPASLFAQDEKNKEKDKEVKEKRDVITIIRKGDKDEKVTVEINGDKVTVNGKPIDEYKEGDIVVRHNNIKTPMAMNRNGVWNLNDNDGMTFFNGDENKAMLGVTTEKTEGGVEVQDVTKESAAEKIGLKEKDVITKIDDQKVEDPDDLSKAIGKHKPGDKVKVTYLRDKKEQTATAELTKWQGFSVFGSNNPGFNYNYDFKMPEMNFPKVQTMPRGSLGQLYNYNAFGGRPRLGLSVQDTDDGKGVKVLDVDDDGNANKAGIKKDDVITEIDGKAVNSADEVAKIVRESKDKTSWMFKLQRNGKTQNIEVKVPRKLKTADL